MITGKLTGAEALLRSTNLFSSRMMERLRTVVARLAVALVAKVKADKLSGQVLGVRSGRLRRSITFKLVNDAATAKAVVGTNLEYGRAHEYGFSGAVSVRSYLRSVRNGEPVQVRSHQRHMNIPERSFLRSALNEMRQQISEEMEKAIQGVKA